MSDIISKEITAKPVTTKRRSIAKTISWRILGSLDTMLLGYLITGSFTMAGSIASAEVITKIFLYYLHERGWAHIKWGHN